MKFLWQLTQAMLLGTGGLLALLIMGAVVYKHFIMPDGDFPRYSKNQMIAEGMRLVHQAGQRLSELENAVVNRDECIRQRDARIEELETYITENHLPVPFGPDEPTLAPIPIEVQ